MQMYAEFMETQAGKKRVAASTSWNRALHGALPRRCVAVHTGRRSNCRGFARRSQRCGKLRDTRASH